MTKIVPFFFYLLGLGSLLFSDLLVTGFFSEEEIALWAETRSVIAISGVLCLVGLDQVLVRSPRSSSSLLRILAIQVPLLAVIVGSFFRYMGFLDSLWAAVGIAMGSAASLALFQYFRSHRLNMASQFAQQGWKVMALAAVAWMLLSDRVLPLGGLVAVLLVFSVLLSSLLLLRFPPSRVFRQNPESASALYQIGSRFMVTSLMLALAVYAEQLVVNALGSANEAALYFTHATYFLFPASVLNGYLAFVIGPWVRDNHDRFVGLLAGKWAFILLLAVAYAAIVGVVGRLLWAVVGPSVGEPDILLQLAFLLSVVARTLYTLPGGYIGVFGRPKEHDLLILGQVMILLFVVALFFVLWDSDLLALVYVVALLSGLNWVLRTTLGFTITGVIARRQNV